MKITKYQLFTISNIFIWVILLIKEVDIPCYFGNDWAFADPITLISIHNVIALLSIGMIVWGLINVRRLVHRANGSPTALNVKVKEISDKSCDFINSLASLITVFSIATLDFSGLRGALLLLIVIFVIYICTINSNWYYSNPIFALMGFRIGIINTETDSPAMPDGSIVLYRGDIEKDTYVTPYHISDNVYLIRIPQNNAK